MLARREFLQGLVAALLQAIYAIFRGVTDAATGRPSGTVESTPDGITVINHHWATFENDEGVRVTLQNTGSESVSLVFVVVTFYGQDGELGSADLEFQGALEPGDRINREATCGCERADVERYEVTVADSSDIFGSDSG